MSIAYSIQLNLNSQNSLMNKVSFSEENSGLDVKSSMVLCSYFLLPMVERLYDGDLHGADG